MNFNMCVKQKKEREIIVEEIVAAEARFCCNV